MTQYQAGKFGSLTRDTRQSFGYYFDSPPTSDGPNCSMISVSSRPPRVPAVILPLLPPPASLRKLHKSQMNAVPAPLVHTHPLHREGMILGGRSRSREGSSSSQFFNRLLSTALGAFDIRWNSHREISIYPANLRNTKKNPPTHPTTRLPWPITRTCKRVERGLAR
ncbi:hypothetical protein BDQ12DRAFT_666292 [Crucibulum laeve]|uniref:Uncharacterized protein n=1 Tax=Crucibulum laeve TaxID=68775 RepID=A0A5C3LYX7_9AGAR|nr:hypothetical protein BDQ12DRAFT_666292 [Crucibulum laeve]